MKEEKIKLPGKILGWLLCIVFLVGCSITIVTGANGIFESKESWTKHINQSELNKVNYVLYWRAMWAQNPEIGAPDEVFFGETVYNQPIFDASAWNNYIGHYDGQLDYNDNIQYLVLDNKNHRFMDGSAESELLEQYIEIAQKDGDSNAAEWTQKMQQEFGYYTIIQYDADGTPTVLDSFGAEKADTIASLQNINEFGQFKTPVYEKVDSPIVSLIENADLNGNFMIDGEAYVTNGTSWDDTGYYYSYYNIDRDEYYEELAYRVKEYVNPSGIKDITILLAISEPMDIEPSGSLFYMSYNYYSIPNGFIFLLLGILVAIIIAAIATACIKPMGVATGAVSKIPLEVIGVAAVVIVYVLQPFAWLTRYHSKGKIIKYLVKEDLSNGAAKFMDAMIIYGGWFLFFAIIFFSIISILCIFRKGVKRYCLENTLVIRFAAWIIRLAKKGLNHLFTIDYHNAVNGIVLKVVVLNFLLITFMCCIWFFGIPILIIYSFILFYFLRKYLTKLKAQYDTVLGAAHNMAQGQLDCQLDENLELFNPLASELNKVQDGFKRAVQEEVKSQKMKTELITNVSHDLKTPLTAIITYVNLLKEEGNTIEQQKEYIEVLDNKAMRLKQLIEDLFEVSKINSSNVTLDPVDVDVVELIKQAQLELSDRFEEAGIDYRLTVPEEKVILHLDSQKTYRIFENLFVNVVKYAQRGTRAYMSVTKDKGEVEIILKNVSAQELNIQPEQLTERFVRGDESRNTEGSGLGLAIVKSIVEVQGGRFTIEVDGDLFKARIHFHQPEPKKEKEDIIL